MQRPPHLTCVMSYESACSMYQAARRGGIYINNFQSHWFNNTVVPRQRGARDGSLSAEELAANRADCPRILATTEYPEEGTFGVLEGRRSLSDITVPMYLAGNWTDAELHLPGNIRAFNGISSEHKWLEMHTGDHLAAFYKLEHVALQRKFLDYFLFDKKDNGMLDVPRIRLTQTPRHPDLVPGERGGFPTPGRRRGLSVPDACASALPELPRGGEAAVFIQGLQGEHPLHP